MRQWPNRRALDLLGIDVPIIQAPMAGSDSAELAIAVSEAGGLGSLACALFDLDRIQRELAALAKATDKPINLNFFCHQTPEKNPAHEKNWARHLERFYRELGLDADAPQSGPSRGSFSEDICALLEELKPRIVSFHFGLPEKSHLDRLKQIGTVILSSATSVAEALWLEARGCDAIIAQGAEAGGHRGMFLTTDASTQTGTMALVPQIVDAVKVPVIAAGGIGDARGIVAALALGASAVQLGTAYLFCPEAKVSGLHLEALKTTDADQTVLTNVFSGRPARGILNRFIQEVGPISSLPPPFPAAGSAVGPLRKKSETLGSKDFMQLWSGQAARLCHERPAGALTTALAQEALKRIAGA